MHTSLAQLKVLLGAENVFEDRAALTAWNASPLHAEREKQTPLPLAAVRPRHCGHVREVLDFCRQNGFHLRIRGAGTEWMPQHTDQNAILLLTSGLDRILELEAENRLALVQCGVSASALNKALASQKLYYPHQLFSASPSTIGGQLAVNAPDLYTFHFGCPGLLAEEIEVYLSTGEKLNLPGQNWQSPAPIFPLAPLFCGSFGLLGLITTVKLRLLSCPDARRSFIAEFKSDSAAIQASAHILDAGLDPDALEIINSEVASLCLDRTSACLYFSFSGTLSAVDELGAKATALMGECNLSALAPEEDKLALLAINSWKIRLQSALAPSISLPCWLPQDKLALFQDCLDRLRKEGVKAAWTIHAGLACANIVLFGKALERLKSAEKELFALELMLNNRMASETEADLGRESWRKERTADLRVTRELARLFDPMGLFSSTLF